MAARSFFFWSAYDSVSSHYIRVNIAANAKSMNFIFPIYV